MRKPRDNGADQGSLRNWVVIATVLVGVTAAYRFLNLHEHLRALVAWTGSLGAAGPLAFVLIYVLSTVLLVPGTLLTLGAGVIFGLIRGFAFVWIGATLGAVAAFLVSRHFARESVSRRIAANKRFQALDQAVARHGWKIVILTRLSPLFPFNLLNYTFGITQISLKDYTIASAIGMLPGTAMYVYIGALAGNLATLDSQERSRSKAEWVLYIVGFAATVMVSLYVTRLAGKALKKQGAD
jgi:uncharacterized membrane protein YdjX (TVP38/TMEM64 family)